MKAIVQDRYGSPDVLQLREVEMPTIGDDGVLVRVRASSVNALDWHLMRGRPYVARVGVGLSGRSRRSRAPMSPGYPDSDPGPNANAYAERVIQTVRAECTDWTLILGRRHLDRTLRTYAEHYNRGRPNALSRSRHPWRKTRSLWL